MIKRILFIYTLTKILLLLKWVIFVDGTENKLLQSQASYLPGFSWVKSNCLLSSRMKLLGGLAYLGHVGHE